MWKSIVHSPLPPCLCRPQKQVARPQRSLHCGPSGSSAVLEDLRSDGTTAKREGGAGRPCQTNEQAAHRPRSAARSAQVETTDQHEAARQEQQQQRQRLLRKTDLQQIPGIGPRNEELLLAKQVSSVQRLRDVFRQHACEQSHMVTYLQDKVGIRFKSHCVLIADHLKRSIDEESSDSGLIIPGQQKLTLCVEGNIGTGKSSFLKMVEAEGDLQVVPEPVEQWQNIDGTGMNMLEAFYRDPQRYAYTFQNYVFVTRVMQERNSKHVSAQTRRLLERSVFSDRMVFVRAVHEAQWMNDLELTAYDSWFAPIVSALPSVIPDGFIYLQADPSTCMRRMQRRSRGEESSVDIKYLEGLHCKHEEWLADPGTLARKAKKVDKLSDTLLLGCPDRPHMSRPALTAGVHGLDDWPELPPAIADQVYLLDGSRRPEMHQRLHGVPALVINYDTDFDLQDPEAKRTYAAQVKQYFDWVDQLRCKRMQHAGSGLAGPVEMQMEKYAAHIRRLQSIVHLPIEEQRQFLERWWREDPHNSPSSGLALGLPAQQKLAYA